MKNYRVYILKLGVYTSIMLAALMPASARAGQQSLTYDVYAGGMRVVEAIMDVNIDQKTKRYDIIFSAYTRGLLGRLAPWRGTFESHGWVNKDGSLSPRQHKSTSTWRGETEVKAYDYTREGRLKSLSVTDHDKPTYIREVDISLTGGTTDSLSAMLGVFQTVARGGDCKGSAEVFDGKRRFKQIFAHQNWSDLSPSRYNIFSGAAAECVVEVEPVAGNWGNKPRGWLSIQEQGREKGTMPTVWTAALTKGEPAVPVKIRVKTKHGTMFMHLTKYESDEQILIANKRSK